MHDRRHTCLWKFLPSRLPTICPHLVVVSTTVCSASTNPSRRPLTWCVPLVFRSVITTTICRLMDEASELAVYCLIGDVLSCVGIGPCGRGGSPGVHSGCWALVPSLGANPLGNPCGGGNVAISAMWIHQPACACGAGPLRDLLGG